MPTNIAIPPISTKFAHVLTFAFALSYVGSLYVSKSTRLSFSSKAVPSRGGEARRKEQDERWRRDDPDVTKAWLASVSLASLGCCFAGSVVVYCTGSGEVSFGVALLATIQRLDLNLQLNPHLQSIYHLLTPLLFTGPLYASFLGGFLPLQRRWSFRENLMPFATWMGLRNYVLAPVTEEIVFRACVLSVYHESGASRARMIFLSPLSFGAAHINHAWETYNRYGRNCAAAKRAIITSLFQFTYTTLHCAFLFLRTGSVLPPISAHVFCNIMGVPQLGSELGQFPRYQLSILVSYVLGVSTFVYCYWPLTEVRLSLYW